MCTGPVLVTTSKSRQETQVRREDLIVVKYKLVILRVKNVFVPFLNPITLSLSFWDDSARTPDENLVGKLMPQVTVPGRYVY